MLVQVGIKNSSNYFQIGQHVVLLNILIHSPVMHLYPQYLGLQQKRSLKRGNLAKKLFS